MIKKLRTKLIWLTFICMGFLILLIQQKVTWKLLKNFIEEFKNIIKRNSCYIEDGDYNIIHKKDL